MSTLSNPAARIPFSLAAPVFVLVDLPTLPFLRGLKEEGAVRWVQATTERNLLLSLFVLSLDGPDPLHFVVVRSRRTVRAMVEWLRRERGFEHDLELGQQLDSYLVALMRHLAGTFATFDATRALWSSDG